MWLYLPGAFAYIRAAMNLSHDLQYAVDLARASGKIILDQYGKVERLTKTNSASTDEAVTVADRASQRAIVAGLRVRFPDDGIVGEESETGESITFETKNPGGRNWVIDPIDGTNNFIAGLGIFGVCIGLMDAGRPVLGVVYDVTRDVVYAAARGEGAWMGSRQIRAPKSPLDESSMIMFTSNLLTGGKCPAWAHKFLAQSTWKLRILGSAALEATYVAAGIAHGAVTVNGKLWDCAASAAIVLEAGGMLTDLRGNEIFPFDLTRYQGAKVPFLASAPQAHGELLEMIVSNS
jgi:myo-inositol-1(or 4)-monophosphatase